MKQRKLFRKSKGFKTWFILYWKGDEPSELDKQQTGSFKYGRNAFKKARGLKKQGFCVNVVHFIFRSGKTGRRNIFEI